MEPVKNPMGPPVHPASKTPAPRTTCGPAERFTDRYDLFVFDLDGTLADTREDLADSVNLALERLGKPPIDLATVVSYVGDGARILIERVLPESSPLEVESALRDFIETYTRLCTRKTRLYPGVRDALEGLCGGPLDSSGDSGGGAGSGRGSGGGIDAVRGGGVCRGEARQGRSATKTLAVLTNKPSFHSRKILEFLGVAHLFARIEGGDTASVRKPDPAGLLALARELGHDLRRTLVVGDSSTDILTARAAGCDAAFVPYGFRPLAHLQTPPDYLLETLRDLLGPL